SLLQGKVRGQLAYLLSSNVWVHTYVLSVLPPVGSCVSPSIRRSLLNVKAVIVVLVSTMSATLSSTSTPSPFLIDPVSCFTSFSSYPWYTLARHFAALAIYGLAFAQWPTYGFRKASELNSGYTLSTATFTLVFWCACFFHYMISAGRVDVDWANGRFLARGWLVRSSRTTHRAILVMALAVSSATVIQTSTVHSILFVDCIAANTTAEMATSDFTAINLLKTDFILCIVFSIYLGVRLCVEPSGLLKRGRGANRRSAMRALSSEIEVNDENTAVNNGEHSEVDSKPNLQTARKLFQFTLPDMAEECGICAQRLANRQLNCGHLICCCCIVDLIKYANEPLSSLRCPFCRQPIYCARELRLFVSQTIVSLTKCCSSDNALAVVV
uniref:RING-type domain-containing protein n=1 Tax=Parascaris univalens TaxID=6257 RepID=A0A915C9G6_PARUN